MRRATPVCLALALAVAHNAASQATPLFFSAEIGNAALDETFGDRFSQVVDGDDDAWALGVGWRLGKRLAVVAEYHDLGDVPGFGAPCSDRADVCAEVLVPVAAESTAATLALEAYLPVLRRRLLLYGKAGVVSWSSDVSQVLEAAEELIDDFRDEDFLYGAGLRLDLPGPLDAYAEIERLGDAFELVNLGVTLGF